MNKTDKDLLNLAGYKIIKSDPLIISMGTEVIKGLAAQGILDRLRNAANNTHSSKLEL